MINSQSCRLDLYTRTSTNDIKIEFIDMSKIMNKYNLPQAPNIDVPQCCVQTEY